MTPRPDDLAGVRCLYISYNALESALVRSQVVPYLFGLRERGAQFSLLTFEPQPPRADDGGPRARLLAEGIRTVSVRYHQRPTLAATGYDIAVGATVGAWLARRQGINLVHARGYPPAAMALLIKRTVRVPFVFDMRGLMADEYVDAGRWTRQGLPYRLTKRAERLLLRSADATVVLTNRIRPILWPAGADREAAVTTIPCGVDLAQFPFRERPDTLMATRLGLGNKRILVSSGSLGTWYLPDEMLRFVRTAHAADSRVHLLILNQGEHHLIRERAATAGLPTDAFTVLAVPPSQVPSYLAVAEAGLCFVKPAFSKLASSPIKLGEYLATGLPVIATAGVGDVDEMIQGNRVGTLISQFSDEDFRATWSRFDAASIDPSLRPRCRATAESLLDVAAGVARYAAVYARLRSGPPRRPWAGSPPPSA
ncbi:MAG: glycosyltransferase [Chloroflexi bacterium]|nr:glycosyltransferase [Chloroflexota bacterium]